MDYVLQQINASPLVARTAARVAAGTAFCRGARKGGLQPVYLRRVAQIVLWVLFVCRLLCGASLRLLNWHAPEQTRFRTISDMSSVGASVCTRCVLFTSLFM